MHQSTDPAQRPPQLTLTNGLRVRLLSLPHSGQAAALVRVHAGSHDAPRAYPGLAHFLEHLLFLGSRDYPVAQSLMPFIQACGGQLNASTRERHTDFFFQLPAGQLEEGLRRLLDMLAYPLLDPEAQVREREVLHAEFLARAKDRETLSDAALARAIDSTHPASGFHAGNRETLPVDDPDFQQALHGYHQRFYRTGQMELLLAGPQSEAVLQRLAEQADISLIAGTAVRRSPPVLHARTEGWSRLQLEQTQPRLLLAFIVDGLDEHALPALDYLATWIASEAPNGLSQCLQTAGLCQALSLRVPYWFARQGVLVIEALLTSKGLAQRATVVDALTDWLRFFVEPSCWQACWDEYRLIAERSLHGAEPLKLLRHWVEPLAWAADSGEAGIGDALRTLITRMTDTGPVILTVETAPCGSVSTDGFPLRMASEPQLTAAHRNWRWQIPQPNPWLKAAVSDGKAANPVAALRWLGPTEESGKAALMLRWRFAELPVPALWHGLSHALQGCVWAARQAGVELRFEDMGHSWTLSLCGFAEAVPPILRDVAYLLAEPPEASLAQVARLAEQHRSLGQDEMLLRQLLSRLPRLVAGMQQSAEPAGSANREQLHAAWNDARWDGLAVGFSPHASAALLASVGALPGKPALDKDWLEAPPTESRWHQVGDGVVTSDTAFILFCPLADRHLEGEAAWRVLGRLLEGDFFRRIRSELQLGYAVLSRFCQFAGQPGMLFAVQSPTASATEIFRQIEAFLDTFALQLAERSTEDLTGTAHATADQQVAASAGLDGHAERAWQAVLAGHESDRIEQVIRAMRELRPADLMAALHDLRGGAGRFIVTNAPAPDGWDR